VYTFDVNGMQTGGEPLAGAELIGNVGDSVQSDTVGTPNFQLENSSGSWSNWTTSIPTNSCYDFGLGLTETSKYQNFSTSGNLNP
jgi:hypothetical protein